MLLFLFVYACSEEVDELKRQMQKIEIDLKKEATEIYIFCLMYFIMNLRSDDYFTVLVEHCVRIWKYWDECTSSWCMQLLSELCWSILVCAIYVLIVNWTGLGIWAAWFSRSSHNLEAALHLPKIYKLFLWTYMQQYWAVLYYHYHHSVILMATSSSQWYFCENFSVTPCVGLVYGMLRVTNVNLSSHVL